jgi:hypothetical protein
MAATHPLAYCPTCKIVFPVATRPDGGVVIKNGMTNCANGHFARVLTAGYQAFEAEIHAALGIHPEIVRKPLVPIVQRLDFGVLSVAEAQAEADAIRPGLGSLFSEANISDPIKRATLTALIVGADVPSGPKAASVVEASPPAVQPDLVEPDEPTAVQEEEQSMAPVSAEAAPDVPTRKGGNRAIQRRLRHLQRLLLNPRGR